MNGLGRRLFQPIFSPKSARETSAKSTPHSTRRRCPGATNHTACWLAAALHCVRLWLSHSTFWRNLVQENWIFEKKFEKKKWNNGKLKKKCYLIEIIGNSNVLHNVTGMRMSPGCVLGKRWSHPQPSRPNPFWSNFAMWSGLHHRAADLLSDIIRFDASSQYLSSGVNSVARRKLAPPHWFNAERSRTVLGEHWHHRIQHNRVFILSVPVTSINTFFVANVILIFSWKLFIGKFSKTLSTTFSKKKIIQKP